MGVICQTPFLDGNVFIIHASIGKLINNSSGLGPA
jgi:hypothetical protein